VREQELGKGSMRGRYNDDGWLYYCKVAGLRVVGRGQRAYKGEGEGEGKKVAVCVGKGYECVGENLMRAPHGESQEWENGRVCGK
jgi:hypothetical protein